MKRFQIDLSEEELLSIDRLGSLAGCRTKRDVVMHALSLFRWAAKETMMGRVVCSINETTNSIRQFDSPALSVIAEFRPTPLTAEEVRQLMAGPSLPRGEFAAQAQQPEGVGSVSSILEKTGGTSLGTGIGTST